MSERFTVTLKQIIDEFHLEVLYCPGDAAEMFHEMATVGVCMAVLVTLVWVGMCIVADSLVKKADNTAKSAQ